MAGMGGDAYRLKALLELREREERARQGELAAAVAETTRARTELAAAEARRDEARRARLEARRAHEERVLGGASSAGEITRARRFLARLDEALSRADEAVAAAAD